MRVTVAVPVLGVDGPTRSRCERWLDGFGESPDWEWDLVMVESGWATWTTRSSLLRGPELPGRRVIQARRPGRGRAVKEVWMSSGAEFMACVDCRLQTNVARLRTLLLTLKDGESDVVVGARVATSAVGLGEWFLHGRHWLAEALTRRITGSRLHDHRSGVVALTAAAVRGLVPHVRSTRDLFEMELLLLAQRLGWRIDEIPLLPPGFSCVHPGVLREFVRLLRDNVQHRKRRDWPRGVGMGG